MGKTRTTLGFGMIALSTLAVVGCENPTGAEREASYGMFATVITAMTGSGEIGSGDRTFYGEDRQVFSLNVGLSMGVPYGQFDYIDYGFLKEDGNFPHFVVGPSWFGTAITTFVPTSAACAEFTGVGYLINTGEYLAFRVQTCDNGQPGAGRDVFGIEVPQRLVTHGNVYIAGPFELNTGELTLREVPGL